MSALKEKQIAIIGTGEPATVYREVLADFPELALHAQIDSADALLLNGRVPHLAVICTPPARHLEEVRPLLHAGVDVLVECPLAATRADAEEITSIAERLGRTAMTADKFRVFEAVREARRLIDAGRIGRLVYVEATRAGKLDATSGWYGDPDSSGGGVWMGYGPDALDVVEMLAGPVEQIRMWKEHRQGGVSEDEVRVETDHGSGLVSRIELSWNREVPAPIARCVGERGEILVGWAQSVLSTERGRETFADGYDEREVRRALLGRFLRERRRSEPVEDRGGQALGWIEAAYRSLDSERWEIA